MPTQIRTMNSQDVSFALSLTSAEDWMSTELDFLEILTHDPHGSFIGEVSGRPVGMVCTVPYESFGFIGNLIVLPRWRGRGFGEALMVHAMDYLNARDVRTHMLDGVDKAVPLYERLGFRKLDKSLRLEGKLVLNQSGGSRAMTHDDLDTLSEYDRDCFGSNRRVFLEARLTNFSELCFVSEDDNRVTGYIMGSQSGEFIRIGPWVVTGGIETAKSLLNTLVSSVPNRVLKVGVLETNHDATSLLQSNGFRQISFSWRMSTKPQEDWSCSKRLFAICSPARG